MDLATKGAFVVLGLLTAGAIWWFCVRDQLRQRRRERAAVWARRQMSPDEPLMQQPLDDETVVLDFLPTQDFALPELDPPVIRPLMEMRCNTDVLPVIRDDQRRR